MNRGSLVSLVYISEPRGLGWGSVSMRWRFRNLARSYRAVPECIGPVFAKTSPNRSCSTIENERLGLVFAKTGPINRALLFRISSFFRIQSENFCMNSCNFLPGLCFMFFASISELLAAAPTGIFSICLCLPLHLSTGSRICSTSIHSINMGYKANNKYITIFCTFF